MSTWQYWLWQDINNYRNDKVLEIIKPINKYFVSELSYFYKC